jgi:8-oxo-dGTP diphosphatase
MEQPHSTLTRGTKNRGASLIFVNSSNEILLFLRDNKPSIPFPNRWDLPGGTVEPGETPRQCIVREIEEEIGYALVDPRLFRVTDFDDREEHTFFQLADFDTKDTTLNEGQRLKWFSKNEIQALEPDAIAFGFRPLLLEFFDCQPYRERGE